MPSIKEKIIFLIGFIYKNFIKKILFLIDPEKVHDGVLTLGKVLGRLEIPKKILERIFCYRNDEYLSQKILGITFKNPIGLAAGFDKNAELLDVLHCFGFGFVEVGSITASPCKGNPKPRLWRYPKLNTLVVYYGLKNDGAIKLSEKLKHKKAKIPFGISIAKTNSLETVEVKNAISDYLITYGCFRDIGDYHTINISCPNAYGGEPFSDPDRFYRLMKEIASRPKLKPIFVKVTPDLSESDLDRIMRISADFKVDGVICSNLTKNRSVIGKQYKDLPEKGGMSGKVVEELSNRQIKFIRKRYNDRFVIVGCGGIFTAEDAYKKIRLGASLLQLITGLVYQGPQLVWEINSGLVKLMKRDGFENISQAVGIDAK